MVAWSIMCAELWVSMARLGMDMGLGRQKEEVKGDAVLLAPDNKGVGAPEAVVFTKGRLRDGNAHVELSKLLRNPIQDGHVD